MLMSVSVCGCVWRIRVRRECVWSECVRVCQKMLVSNRLNDVQGCFFVCAWMCVWVCVVSSECVSECVWECVCWALNGCECAWKCVGVWMIQDWRVLVNFERNEWRKGHKGEKERVWTQEKRPVWVLWLAISDTIAWNCKNDNAKNLSMIADGSKITNGHFEALIWLF